MYNRAYTMFHQGQKDQSRKELEKAKESAAGVSESRHKLIVAALDSMRVSTISLTRWLGGKHIISLTHWLGGKYHLSHTLAGG